MTAQCIDVPADEVDAFISEKMTDLALGAFANITILPDSQSFDWQGGDAAITTSGTGGWKAHKDCSWIMISPRTSGSCGESCIYTISANNTVTNRTGKITIDYLPQHPTNAQKFSPQGGCAAGGIYGIIPSACAICV